MKNICISLLSYFATACALMAANTWYVDADNYGRTDISLDGKSEDAAFGTIQDAVNKAASGDSIFVAEGIYCNGGENVDGYGLSRVSLNGKKLYLKATGRVEKTIIKGEASTAEDAVLGNGAGAVRCVLARYTTACESIIEGFTLQGGRADIVGVPLNQSGGAICAGDGTYSPHWGGPYLVGCVIDNCSSSRSGVSCGSTIIRSEIKNCQFPHKGFFCWGTRFLNSLIAHNLSVDSSTLAKDTLHIDVMSTMINCTFVDNFCSFYLNPDTSLYNNIFSCITMNNVGAKERYEGNYTDSASSTEMRVFAPVVSKPSKRPMPNGLPKFRYLPVRRLGTSTVMSISSATPSPRKVRL